MKNIKSINQNISAVIIAKNAEGKIGNCLKSLAWVDELIVVDTGSTDRTKEIALSEKAKFYNCINGSYSDWRNFGREKANGEYLLYLDSDEVIDESLRKEIEFCVANWSEEISCYAIPRRNIIFGKWLRYGGWYPDYVIRLFKKNKLLKWENILHEKPKYDGKLGYLKNPILHYKEKTLEEMVQKTNRWSEIEAKLMYDANHPQMNLKRFLGAMFREFRYRFIQNLAFLDGGEGIIMGMYQIYSRFISYAKLWEMQINDANKQINTNLRIPTNDETQNR